jgi:hypothetical protein
MKHVAAYLLAVLGGKANPTEQDVTAIIAAGGGKADAEQVKKLIAEFAGKTAEQVIAAGKFYRKFFVWQCILVHSQLLAFCPFYVQQYIQERPSCLPFPPEVPLPPPHPPPLPRAALPLPLPRLLPRHQSPNPKRRRPAASPFSTRKRSLWI